LPQCLAQFRSNDVFHFFPPTSNLIETSVPTFYWVSLPFPFFSFFSSKWHSMVCAPAPGSLRGDKLSCFLFSNSLSLDQPVTFFPLPPTVSPFFYRGKTSAFFICLSTYAAFITLVRLNVAFRSTQIFFSLFSFPFP